jgi:hypothetical protein
MVFLSLPIDRCISILEKKESIMPHMVMYILLLRITMKADIKLHKQLLITGDITNQQW